MFLSIFMGIVAVVVNAPMLALAYVISAGLVGMMGRNRRVGFWGFFLFALLSTPPVFFIVALLTRPRREQSKV